MDFITNRNNNFEFSIEIVERLRKRNKKFLKICQTKTLAFASHI